MSDSVYSGPNQPALPPDYEDIPVEELIRLTREFTRRITNQDRQRLGLELRESGHARAVQGSAPVTLQQFFSGEIDLDTDLARRYQNAPLLSHVHFTPRPGEPARRQATAIFTSNDETATLAVDAQLSAESGLEFTFTLFSALTMRFNLSPLTAADRSRWLDMMRRENGITFLWTRARWEQPHLIFVIREFFGRVYAFSPNGFEAAARMTPDMIAALTEWLDRLWFPDRHVPADESQTSSAWDARPTQMRRPRPALRQAIPDAPEEQWEAIPAPPEDVAPLNHFDAQPPVGDESELSADDLEW